LNVENELGSGARKLSLARFVHRPWRVGGQRLA
jgi:hypothetical protein